MATLRSGQGPHNGYATFPKGSGKGEHKRGLAPPLFFALGPQEQTVEVVLGDALIGAAVLEEEIG